MKNRILLLSFLVIMTSGCALRSDVVYLDDRIDAVEKKMSLQKVETSDATNQVRDATNQVREATNQIRLDYAKLSNEYEGLSERIRQLKGNYDENSHQIEKSTSSSDRLKGDIDKLSGLIVKLDGTISDLAKRIEKLEDYTGINSIVATPSAADASKTDGSAPGKTDAVPPDVKLFTDSKAAMDSGDNKTAREGFQKYIKDYPDSKTLDNVQFLIGESYYQEKWYQKAILEYQKVIETYPKSAKVPAAYLKQGLSFQEIGEGGNAKLIFKQLIKKFPKSSEAAIAKKKLEKLK